MDTLKGIVLWLSIVIICAPSKCHAQYRPKWSNPYAQREIFLLNLEDGYFGCQVNESTDFLQLFELSKLCDGLPQCFLGSDEVISELKCTDRNRCHPKMPKCVNGVCLDNMCYCNDGFGGKGCALPDENECKYRPCDVFAHCTNTMGSFYCSCFPGYDGDGFSCRDTNECEIPSLAAICAENSDCCNLPGHFVCKCKPGFTGNATVSCTDIDECLDPGCCGRGALCENTPGSHTCHCPLGFEGNPAVECWDTDECKANPCGYGAICTNVPGAYQCSCRSGYRGNPSPENGCIDIDECSAASEPICGTHATCVNTPGGYFCQCPAGYTGNPKIGCIDVDECPHACGANAVCHNTPGSYLCQCNAGFVGDPYLSAGCGDDDECVRPNTCGVNSECYNSIGSYQCVCSVGYTGNPSLLCADVDECLQNPCGIGAYCTNTPGSYRCDCPDKYLPRGTPELGCERAAVDVSCKFDFDCTDNAGCTDSACRCKNGYQPSGIECIDVDECKNRYVCGNNARCINSQGAYQCECKNGFEKIDQNPKSKCRDINECIQKRSPCGLNARCINTEGSHKCICKDGFVGDAIVGCKSPCDGINCGSHASCQVNGNEAACICDHGFTFDPNDITAGCIDINECEASHGPSGLCGQGAVCTNVLGSHYCHCQAGFTGDPFRYCEDINECDRRFGPYGQCGDGSLCANTLGSFQCSCPVGFTGNAREKCVDINECSQVFGSNGKCGFSAICTNTPGSYSCRCPPGSSGDPLIKCITEHTCESNSACTGNAVCKIGKCTCPSPYFGEECKHPCDQLFCGEYAKCSLDSDGNPLCICAAGYVGKSNSLPGCVDIDECTNNPCGRNAVCRNTPGAYECICPHNFRGDPYFECSIEGKEQITCSEKNPCPFNEECVHNGKANQCVCRRGYVRDSVGEQCRDINECTELTKSCGLNAFCTNFDGGFVCHCPGGYTGNPYSICYPDVIKCHKDAECPGNTQCIDDISHGKHCGCSPPFIREGDYCILSSRNCSSLSPCPKHQDCILSEADNGYCICPKGFTLEANGHCRDINECIEMNEWDLCGYNAECINLPGTYECVCTSGFSGNGKDGCTRMYESCEDDNKCPTNQRCLRNWCECVPPFIQDGSVCKHPCEWQQCGQNAVCDLGPKGPQCSCKKGCTGNANTGCYDINECTSLLPIDPNGPCAVSAICVNVLGSFKCECPRDGNGDPYTTGCLGPTKCDSNSQCPDNTICDTLSGACADACLTAVCGPNTDCVAQNHKGICQCRPGFSGNPNDLVKGCVTPCSQIWCSINAQCIVNTENQGVCQCLNGFEGNPWAGGGCYPENVCSKSRPCSSNQECVNGLCLERCKDSKCGVGAKCDQHTNRCTCNQFYVGNADILCAPPLPKSPECAPNCGLNAHCTYSVPNKCVCNSGYNGNPYKLCTSVPSCESIRCGTGANCLDGPSSVECVCPVGFHGNPYIACEDVNECLQGNPCGTGANCINVIGSFHCICPSNFLGNPLYACQPPKEAGIEDQVTGIGSLCSTSFNCPSGAVCFRGVCAQQNGCKQDTQCETNHACSFVSKEVGYQCVDPCDTTQCGPNAYCLCAEHKPHCHCKESHTGEPHDLEHGCTPIPKVPSAILCSDDSSCSDGFSCGLSVSGQRVCIDACENIHCGPFSHCQPVDRRPECICQDSYDGNPYDLQKGCFPPICREDSDCKHDETCQLFQQGYRDCSKVCKEFQCGLNAICRGSGHKPHCECRPNFIGDAYDSKFGCQPLHLTCADDSSCPDYQSCRRMQNGLKNCTDVCSNIRCGVNAHCTGRGHQAVCECLPGFVGDAVQNCQKPPQHLCDQNEQCSADKNCVITKEGIRDCVDVCFGHICSAGAHCIPRNHRPHCECLHGYTRLPGDALGACAPNLCQSNRECRDDQVCAITRRGVLDCTDACIGVNCGPNSVCTPLNHQATCQCRVGFYGNPDDLLRGCSPQDVCKSDSDCKSTEVCKLNQVGVKDCIDGCISNLCGSNALCVTKGHFVSCTCVEGYTGRPSDSSVGCYPIPHECYSDDMCPSNAVCLKGRDDINQCRDPCEHFICGENALCVSLNHKAQCVCRQGMVGDAFHKCIDPDECKADIDCPNDSVCRPDTSNTMKCAFACLYVKCGKNAICSAKAHQTQCYCPNGFVGDPYDQTLGCKVEILNLCGRDAECRSEESCQLTNAGRYDCVNSCETTLCGPNAQCKAIGHKGHCECIPGFVGDPNNSLNGCRKQETNECEFDFDCLKRTDVCKPMNNGVKKCFNACQFTSCGVGSLCIASNHTAYCDCIEGFVRDHNAACTQIKHECNEDVHCPTFQSCKSSTIGIQKCADICIDFTCTPNSKCVSLQHKGQCKCDHGFTGDPQSRTGCVPIPSHECDQNTDCSNPNDICLPDSHGIRKCIDGCQNYECGLNSMCVIVNRQAECRCPLSGLYIGNPYDHAKGCQKVECMTDRECPDNKACASQNYCFDPCINGCAINSVCVTQRHSPNCKCLPGYTGDAFGSGCEIMSLCKSNPCHHLAHCVDSPGSFSCHCPPDFIGDAYDIGSNGCRHPVQCPNGNRDCASNTACLPDPTGVHMCKNACEHLQCGPNAVCVTRNHEAQCVCPDNFSGEPDSLGCIRISRLCSSNPDCNDSQACVEGQCRFVCTKDTGCAHGERCVDNFCVKACGSDDSCPDNEACDPKGYHCIDPCQGNTDCGPNALCHVSHHHISCSCPDAFIQRPNATVGCVRESVGCSVNADCHIPGYSCYNGQCRAICSGNKDCAHEEKCFTGRCHLQCTKDKDCLSNDICIQNACQSGCRADSDCPSVATCAGNKCVNPCDNPNACGTNAVCTINQHQKVCACKDGSIGNPYVECTRVTQSCGVSEKCDFGKRCEHSVCLVDCHSDNECFDNEKCINTACSVICTTDNVCPHGFVCDGGLCTPGCRSDNDCPSTDACVNRQCIKVCESPTACGTDAICQGIKHQSWCTCPVKYTGNPKVTCRRIDCVVDNECGTGKICQNYKCLVGCRSDYGCAESESCIALQCSNPCLYSKVCGENAICKVIGHQPVCTCEAPLQGNPSIRCILPRQEAIACRVDTDCSDDKFCMHRQCITRYECISDKECSVGHICVKGKCFSGCRRDEDCSLDMSCVSQQCQNPCSFRGACGLNAQCAPVNHRAKCSCPPNFTGHPQSECIDLPACIRNDDCSIGHSCYSGKCTTVSGCVSDHECSHRQICENQKCFDGCRTNSDCDFSLACIEKSCLNPCLKKECGNNAVCHPINHGAICRCPEGYTGDPIQSCYVEQEECYVDTDCGSSKICVSNRCIAGCRSDFNCPFDKSCIQRRCSDPCSVQTSCGFNALCKAINHRAECSCPPNFQGDAKVHCVEKKHSVEYECEEDKDCGPGKVCKHHYCMSVEKQCYSDTACNPGEMCDAGECKSGCRRDSDCTFDKACFNSKCVNPCSVQTPCGTNAKCQPVLHRPNCRCPPHYEGNPYDYCKPAPQEKTPDCINDKECQLGFICEQTVCVTGCRYNENCHSDTACIHRQCQNPCDFPDSCGVNAQCTPVVHRPRCSCPTGFTGDANIHCSPVIAPVCLHDADCGTGQICETGKCIDACRTDDTCSYIMACINQRCQDPCSVFGACGRNALCHAENHRAVCTCPPEFRGDAFAVCERQAIEVQIGCANDKECGFGLICEATKCVEGCRYDDNCTPDHACFNRICRNPCELPNACGVNADCSPNAHRPVCLCHTGFIGDPQTECRPLQDARECVKDTDCGNRLICEHSRCIIGCRESSGCSLEESCLNRICQNPCSFYGVCGRNAVCRSSNHTAICSCPSELKGNPNVVCTEAPPQCLKDSECVLSQICENTQCITGCRLDNNCPEELACINGVCQNPCLLPNACGVNANCQPFNHRPRCECIGNHRGNPILKCEPIPDDYCEHDSGCALNKICEVNRCVDGCRNDANCRFEEACINKICQNPCNLYGACGINAVCRPLNHDRLCTCVPEHTGDPKVLCERIVPPPECTSDSQCPLEHICQNQRCIHGCRTSNHCPTDKVCVKNKCINPCSHSGACGREAICTPANHVAICNCPSGFRGDPDVECREIPPECHDDDDCGLERICLKQKCIVGCRMHVGCPFDKACVNGFCQSPCSIGGMCGINTICRAEKHEAQCSCLPGYTGDPLRQCSKVSVECEIDKDCSNGYVCANHLCKDINECLKERVPCGPGASCTNLPGWYKCSCPLPLVGDAYGPTGCRQPLPVCLHDADCKTNQKCNPVTQECYDVCSKPGVCGIGAICKATNSRAECSCPIGHRGNPYVECSIRDSCNSHAECPGNLHCLGEFCGCPAPFQQTSSFCILTSTECSTSNPCSPNQECIFNGRNKVSGVCICPRGFVQSSDGSCKDLNECEATGHFPCGPGAMCLNTVGSFKCSCPPRSSGDAYGKGCFAETIKQECLHDADCTDDRSCKEFKCLSPCLHQECGLNAHCVAVHHKAECRCKPLFFGDPHEVCRKPVECVSDANCPGNLICLSDHKCGCPSQYQRKLDYCIKKSQVCTTNNPCATNHECVYTGPSDGFCVCPRGFRLVSNTCQDINECYEEPKVSCSLNATCVNLLGTYECQCYPGYDGDAYRIGCFLPPPPKRGCTSDLECLASQKCEISTHECYDPCLVIGPNAYKCGQNAICRTDNHHSECYCPPGYDGNPYNLCFKKIICGIDYHCPGNLICLDSNTCGCPQNYFRENDYCFIKSQNCTTTNPCPQNEECVYTGSFSGFCVCPHGYELHHLTGECKDIDECLHVHCGSGAICQNKPGNYECSCPVDTIGDAYVKGCKEIDGCRLHEDCANDRECDAGSKQCISPCYICGPVAECTARDHRAICTCPPAKIGDPYDKGLGCYEETPIETRTIPPAADILVMCLADGVQVSLNLNPGSFRFDGIVYVKGHSQDPQCRILVASSEVETIDFKVLFGHCGLIHVDGEASFILIIQKHRKLVTYRARAYHIKCVYNTGEKTITLGFNVSMITTSGTIANTGPPPTCIMSICTLEGKEINSAEIGDDLLLKVDVQPDFIYGGYARSCVAKTMDDEGEFQYEVTDNNGCATDPSIFGNWEYDPHKKTLMARFNAFKFPSSNNLRFQCNIRVCFGSCPPVNCDGVDAYGRRRRRQIRDEDLLVTDSFKEGALREEIMVQSNAILTFEKRESQSSLPSSGPKIEDIEHVCLPKLGLIISMIITTLLALVAVAVAISCWLMAYRRKPKGVGPLPHPPQFPNPIFPPESDYLRPSQDHHSRSSLQPVAVEPTPDYYPSHLM